MVWVVDRPDDQGYGIRTAIGDDDDDDDGAGVFTHGDPCSGLETCRRVRACRDCLLR